MADRIGFTFSGDKEILDNLQRIPVELREKAIPEALRSAGRYVVAKARTLVPRVSGLLRRSLGLILRKGRRTSRRDSYVVIGARTGFGQTVSRDGRSVYADPSKYAHLVEFGHYVVARIKGSSRRKGTARELMFVLPRPFLRPAFMGSIAAVRARLVESLRTFMQRRLQRALKRSLRKAA